MNDLTAEQAFATLSPDRMLDAIESLDFPCNGQFLALNSYENRVYRIGLEEGGHIVAKFYRPNRWSNKSILEEHQFSLDLAQEEIPVIPPLEYQQNTLHDYQGFRFALFPYQGGRAFETDNAEQLEQLGRFMGRIHALGATKPFLHRPEINLQTYVITPKDYLLESGLIPKYLIDNYAVVTHELIQNIQDIYARLDTITHIRLHGDCHPGNILSLEGRPFIVDFDDARMGPAIQDLWMFLSGDRQYMSARLADLLCGYEQFYEFNPDELQLVESLRSMRMVHYAAWLAQRWDDPAFPQAFPWFNTDHYWEEHIQSLREQLSALREPPLIW